MAEPKKRWNFSLRTLLIGMILLSLATYKIHDYFWAVHLIEDGRYPITVDYSKTLEEMIIEGKYDRVTSDINCVNFPMPSDKSGSEKLEAVILHFDKIVRIEDVLKILNRRNLRPGTLPELLAFGTKHPEEQRKYQIFAVGSFWSDSVGDRFIVHLIGGNLARGVELDFRNNWWDPRYNFLAFRKQD